MREGPSVEGEVDSRRLRRGQLHLLECLELLLGLLLGPGHRTHIDLHDLGGCSGPRVGDRQLDLYVGRLPHCHLRPVVVERGVGQAVPETEQRFDTVGIEVAIAHPGALGVDDLSVLAGIVAKGRGVLQPGREGDGQPARRAGVAKEVINQGIGPLFARVPEHHVGAHGAHPWHGDGRAGIDDDDSVGVGGRHPLHQLDLVTGKIEIVTVEALGLPVTVGPDDDHRHLGGGGRRHRAFHGVARQTGKGTDPKPGTGQSHRREFEAELILPVGDELKLPLDRGAAEAHK